MIRNLLLVAACAGGAALLVPALYERNPQLFERLMSSGSGAMSAETRAAPAQPMVAAVQAPTGRKVRLEADGRGHFSAEFRINGRAVPAMIDTGATVVAINQSTARRIGVAVQPSDYRATVETANGVVKAAAVQIERLEIGRIVVTDVAALVLDDRALSGTLVGMSFLSRLSRYRVEAGALLLEQ